MKNKIDTVAVILVTFNRRKLLVECLQGLLKQTQRVDKIYIIDNASSDGTKDILEAEGYLSESIIEYVKLDINIGGSGGFHEGVKRGFEGGYDWLWLMDDDVEPLPSALEGLMKFKEYSSCIQAGRMFSDGSIFNWNFTFDPTTMRSTHLNASLSFRDKNYFFSNVGCFEGMLIKRTVVEKIGLPNQEFFIGFDDTLYGFLASLHTNLRVTTEPFIIKKIKNVKKSKLKAYYYIRNIFLLKNELIKTKILRDNLIKAYFILYYLLTVYSVFKNFGLIDGVSIAFKGTRDGLRKNFGPAFSF